MFQVGEQVVYGVHGVCNIVNSEEKVIDRKRLIYLVLEPVGQPGSKYMVPTHNAAAMGKLKKILSKADLEEIIQSDAVHTDGWIADENSRKQTYRDLITSGDRVKLMRMVRSLYQHKAAQAQTGKKCHLSDENFLRDAEKLLTSEISIVMDLDQDEAKRYLRKQLNA